MNIHLLVNQVTMNEETILHLSFPCLKLILDLTMNLMVSISLHSWKHDKEINSRNTHSSLFQIVKHQTQ
jgi:hypothetical protein